MLMHINSLVYVKDQYKIRIFDVKLVEQISILENNAAENYALTSILYE